MSSHLCRSALSLERLPNELLRGIFSWLHVKDIIRARLVSSFLCSFSRQRIVWLDALRRESLANHIPLHNYPDFIQAESRRIEHYALAPYKFVAQVSQDVIRANRERIMRLEASQGEDNGDIVCMLVLPGGRYIVTGSSTGWVVVWDLCLPVGGATHPAIVLQKLFPGPIFVMEIAFATEDEVMILVDHGTHEFQQCSFQTMRFSLTNSTDEPRISKAIQSPDGFQWVDVNSAGIIMIAYDAHIFVFNSQTEGYAVIDLAFVGARSADDLFIAYFHRSDIVAFQRRGRETYFLVYAMPNFHPTFDAANANPVDSPRILHRLSLSTQDTFVFLSIPAIVRPSWLQTLDTLRLPVIYRLSSGTCTPHVIVDHHPSLSPASSIPLPFALPAIPSSFADGMGSTVVEWSCLVDDVVVAMRTDEKTLICHTPRFVLSTVPKSMAPEATQEAKAGSLIGRVHEDDRVLALNPWRGEVYTSMDYGACEVRTFEYFAHHAT